MPTATVVSLLFTLIIGGVFVGIAFVAWRIYKRADESGAVRAVALGSTFLAIIGVIYVLFLMFFGIGYETTEHDVSVAPLEQVR